LFNIPIYFLVNIPAYSLFNIPIYFLVNIPAYSLFNIPIYFLVNIPAYSLFNISVYSPVILLCILQYIYHQVKSSLYMTRVNS